MPNRFRSALNALFARDKIDEPFLSGPRQATENEIMSYYRQMLELSGDRLRCYKDYSDMGSDSLIAGALDLLADEAAQYDRIAQATVWVESDNPKVAAELTTMFDRIRIEEHIWGLCRNVAQFGDNFVRPLANAEKGVVALEFLDPELVECIVDRYARLTGFKVQGLNMEFRPYDIVHFKITGRTKPAKHGGTVYGTAFLENARKTWRTLSLLEEVLIIYRMEIGGRHRIFYIDVGDVSYQQGIQIAKTYETSFGKKQWYNPQSGEFSERFNPLNLSSDIFWPIRKDSGSRVEYLGTDANITGIVDIDYFRDKLFASLKTPKAYIGGDDYSSVRYGLSQVDINYSRVVKRLQRSVCNGLTRLGQIHLSLRGFDALDQKNDFVIMMSTVSALDQEQRMEALSSSVDLAMKLKQAAETIGIDGDAIAPYIARTFLGLTPYDLNRVARQANSATAGLSGPSSPLPYSANRLGGDRKSSGSQSLNDGTDFDKLDPIVEMALDRLAQMATQSDRPALSGKVDLLDGVFSGINTGGNEFNSILEMIEEDGEGVTEAPAGREPLAVEIDEGTLERLRPYLRNARKEP